MSKAVKLGEIGNFVSGGTPSRKHPEYFEGSIPWVSTPALNGGMIDEADAVQMITEQAIASSATKLLPPRSLLIGVRVGVGKTAVNLVPMCTNQDIVAITGVDESLWDIRYVSYAVQAKSSYLVSQKQGATITGITSKLLKGVEIQQRSIEDQRCCVRMLDSVKDRIKDASDGIEKLDELVKSRFVEMFGTPHEMDRWRVCDVSEIADVTVGVVVKPAQYYVEEGEGVRAFRSLNIAPMRVKNDSWVYFSKEGNEKNKKSQLHAGDVVLVRSGAPGVACVVTQEYEGCNAVDIIIARLDKDQVDPVFFAAFMNYPHGQVQITDGTGGSAQQHFNVGTCKKMRFVLPPLSLQQEFAAFVQQVDKLKFETQQAIEKLQLLYDSLAQEYFGG